MALDCRSGQPRGFGQSQGGGALVIEIQQLALHRHSRNGFWLSGAADLILRRSRRGSLPEWDTDSLRCAAVRRGGQSSSARCPAAVHVPRGAAYLIAGIAAEEQRHRTQLRGGDEIQRRLLLGEQVVAGALLLAALPRENGRAACWEKVFK